MGVAAVAAGGPWEGPQSRERGQQRRCPGPVAVEAQPDPAGVADEPGGGVPQPIPQGLGLGDFEIAVQQQRLRPAHQRLRHQHQGQPDVVGVEVCKGEVAEAGGLGTADAVLDAGVGAVADLQRGGGAGGRPGRFGRVGRPGVVAGLQGGGVGILLVGDEHLEAVAGVIGKGHLVAGAGVGPLAAADRPGPHRPALAWKVQGRKLPHPRAGPLVAVGVQGLNPAGVVAWGWRRQRQDRGLDVGLQREPDRNHSLRPTRSATNAWVAPAVSARTRIGPARAGFGSASSAIASTSMWSWAVLEPALPARKIPLNASPVPSPRSSQQHSGCNPKPCLNVPAAPCLSACASTRLASRSSRNGPGPLGAAPAAQARWRTRASADHTPATPLGSAATSWTTRHAVGVEHTLPNSPAWSRSPARSLRQSPPSASMTTRSRSTAPRSYARLPPGRARPRLARRPSSLVSASRSASSASSTTPAWLQMPWASAVTSKRGRELLGCTGGVTLLLGDGTFKQSHPPWSGGSPATWHQQAQRPREISRLVPDLPCGEARSGVKIGRGRPLTSYVLGRCEAGG